MLKDPHLLLKRNQRLWQYLSDSQIVNDDLDFIDKLTSETKAELRKGIRLATQLQLSYALKKMPQSLQAWYDHLKSELETATIQVKATKNKDAIVVTTTVSGSSALLLDKIQVFDQDHKLVFEQTLNQNILPQVKDSQNQCLQYKPQIRTDTLSCDNCQSTQDIIVTGKNLITQKPISLQASYEN